MERKKYIRLSEAIVLSEKLCSRYFHIAGRRKMVYIVENFDSGFKKSSSLFIRTRNISQIAYATKRCNNYYQKPIRVETCNARSQLPNIQCELIH